MLSDFPNALGRWMQDGKEPPALRKSPVVANSIADLLIYLEEHTGKLPHAYLKWKEGNPVANILRFLFLERGIPHRSPMRF